MKESTLANFPLVWRWTQRSHAVFPLEVLETIHPLPETEASRLYALGMKIEESHDKKDVKEGPATDLAEGTAWLLSLPVSQGELALVAWDKATGVSVPWGTLATRWDDFFYPSSDDAFIYLEKAKIAIWYAHYECFYLFQNAV